MKIGDRIFVRGYIDEIRKDTVIVRNDGGYFGTVLSEVTGDLPSAQPEIIRCKDCKYQDENWRRVSVGWLPCMDVRTGSNWYCGSAERGEQDG